LSPLNSQSLIWQNDSASISEVLPGIHILTGNCNNPLGIYYLELRILEHSAIELEKNESVYIKKFQNDLKNALLSRFNHVNKQEEYLLATLFDVRFISKCFKAEKLIEVKKLCLKIMEVLYNRNYFEIQFEGLEEKKVNN
jgi:hypothetical protein